MISFSVIHEGPLLWRKDKKEKWEKVHVRLGTLNKQNTLRVSLKPEHISNIVDSINISKELVIVGPTQDKEKYSLQLSNGKEELQIAAEKQSIIVEWLDRINTSRATEEQIQNPLPLSDSQLQGSGEPPESPTAIEKKKSPRSSRRTRGTVSQTRLKRSLSHSVPKIFPGSKERSPKGKDRKTTKQARSPSNVNNPIDSKLTKDNIPPLNQISNGYSFENFTLDTESYPKCKTTKWIDPETISDLSDSEDSTPKLSPKKEPEITEDVIPQNGVTEKKREDRRKLIVTEIYTTEKNYVDSLSFVIEKYMKPLLASAEFTEIQQTILQIFGNIEVLYGFNQKLLEEISKITSNWSSGSVIGPMFKTMLPFLKMYTAYSNNHTLATSTLDKLLRSNDKFKNVVSGIFENSGSGLDLRAYLIMPIQRIPRYSLLLKDLLSHTAVDHPDYPDLSDSFTKIGEVASHINEEVRRYENNQRLEEMLSKGIDLTGFIQPHRYFINYGALKVQREYPSGDTKKEGTKMFILFNDIFLHLSHKKNQISVLHDLKKPQYSCPVELLWLDDTDPNETKLLAPISEKLSFSDKDWTQALKKAIQARIDFIKKGKGRLRRECNELIRFGSFTFPDGGKYCGQWKLGKRDGRGTWEDMGTIYKGQWKDDQIEGKGYFTYLSRDQYFGEWSGGQPHGKGTLKYVDETKFIGEWARGIRSGPGKIEYATGNYFRGLFKDDRPVEGELSTITGFIYKGSISEGLFNGVGIISLPDGSVYEGDIKDGIKHGRGVMKYSSENGKFCTYYGSWENDLRHGIGTLVDNITSSRYHGQWAMDKPNGTGRKEYTDSTVYEGEWVDGLRSGKGKCIYGDGYYYEGDWAYDKHHGEGEGRDSTGIYRGSWIQGSKQGRGKFYFSNGGTYKGNVQNGWPHKSGIYIGGDSDFIESYDGEWVNGVLHGKGILKLQNGDNYQGSFANNTFNGEGIYTTAKGIIYEGKWEWGILVNKVSITYPNISLQNIPVTSNSITVPYGSSMNICPILTLFPIIPNSSSRR